MNDVMVLFMTLSLLSSFALCDELKFVGVIVRHGARAPSHPIPDLEHRVFWHNGYEELTSLGQRQLYLFGRLLRKKYIEDEKFLPASYNPSKVTFRSTYYHRTTSSAQSLAVGLYPDGLEKLAPEQLDNKNGIWLPPQELHVPDYVKTGLKNSSLPFDLPSIPVLNFAAKYDRAIVFDSCPRYGYYRKSYYNTSAFRETYQKHNKTFQEICGILNIRCDRVEGYNTFLYADYIFASIFDGQLPELAARKDLVDHVLRFYTDLMLGELVVNPVMKSISLHGFSESYPEFFEHAISDPEHALKMSVWATHDSTLLAYLVALGIPRGKIYEVIEYASNFVIELRQSPDKEYYVNVFYNGADMFGKVPMHEFVQKIKQTGKLEAEWDEICKIPEQLAVFPESAAGKDEVNWWVILPGIIFMMVAVGVAIRKLKGRKSDSTEAPESAMTFAIINH